MPVVEPTVAFPLLMLHVPPPASDRVVVNPAHTARLPMIAVGSGYTVTIAVMIQPVPIV
jgi:hypothetical protein